MWILVILSLEPSNETLHFSLFGEVNFFSKYFFKQQTIIYNCESCEKEAAFPKSSFQLKKNQNSNTYLDFDTFVNCRHCSKVVYGSFSSSPFCLIVEPFYTTTRLEEEFNLLDLPMLFEIDNKKFKFICATIGDFGNFKAIFCLNKSFYLINDMDTSKALKKIPKLHKISTIYYSFV